MNRFIRYLYEYQQGQRTRNVGFVKVEQDDDNTVIHIHGKGLRLDEDKTLRLYIFYMEQKDCIGVWQGDIEHVNPSVNYRLMFTPEDTGAPCNYNQIDGIIMENPGKRCFAAVWSDKFVDVEHMQKWEADQTPLPAAEEPAEEFAVERKELDVPQETEEEQEETFQEASEEVSVEVSVAESVASREIFPKCTKIQRQDIAKLPRCEWRLANNSFLMHGCYNYHHLLLIQQENGWWLGVPGIHHQREWKAAKAFGFPEFMRLHQLELDLTEEEGMGEDNFGYWCRQIRR